MTPAQLDSDSLLHRSINLRAMCDGRELDPERDSESPECRDLEPCKMCMLLAAHQRRSPR